ncbi:MAG TPA: hypothetical protein PKK99_13540, partial [Bacteroidia bacterium]|nr:hypothetical protein [Bacteroidia bacterium]
MDKNSIIGLSLIGLLIVGYSIYTQPSKEELAAARHKQDSIAALQKASTVVTETAKNIVVKDSSFIDTLQVSNDSLIANQDKQLYGDFAEAAKGTEQLLTLENSKVKVEISSKGGRIRAI